MATSAPNRSGKPEPILVTLLLERPVTLDYNSLSKRLGTILDIKPRADHKPDFPMVLIVDGELVAGIRFDKPFPEPLDAIAAHTFWWPNALADVARTKSHVAITSYWSKYSRLD